MLPSLALTEQERIQIAHILDLHYICQKKNIPKYSFFLNERERYLSDLALKDVGASRHLFYGGYDDAQRTCVAFFPDYMELNIANLPIVPITFTFREKDKLSHRDFLGSFMSLKLKREAIGDILVHDGLAVAFVYETVSSLILSSVTKIGRVGVRAIQGMPPKLSIANEFQEICGTIASPRLDAIVSLAANVSRERAALLIRSGSVVCNHMIIGNGAQRLDQGDVFSIRGFGKYSITGFGGMTRKGRMHVRINKYI